MRDFQEKSLFQHSYNLDMMRVVAMFLVVLHHVLCVCGIENAAIYISPMKEWCYSLMHSLSCIDVDLFALLTGYLCFGKKWKIARWVKLWVLVIFYGIVVSFIGKLIGGYPFPVKYALKNLLPLMSNYWYFSAYTALFFVMPFINKVLTGLTIRQWHFLLGTLFLVFSVGDSMLPNQFMVFSTDGGHTALWLGILYIFGAYIKIHPFTLRKLYLLILLTVLIIVWSVIARETTLSIGNFQNPIICLAALSCFLLLLNCNIRSNVICKALKWMSPMAFSVYLIHIGLYRFMETELPALFLQLGYPWWLPLVVAGGIYIACTLMDYLRIQLFRWMRVETLCDRLVGKLPEVLRKEEW